MVNSDNKLQTRTAASAGGVMLAVGGALFLITIGFEFQVGWLTRDPDIPVGDVIKRLWPSLQNIWTVQMAATALLAGAALNLVHDTHAASRDWPLKIVWSLVSVGAVMATAGFAVTLSAYPAALAALEAQPELFATTRDIVAGLYRTGLMTAMLGLLVLLIREGIPARSLVPRATLVGTLAVLALGIGLSTVGSVPNRIGGAVIFVIPVVLGICYWRSATAARAEL